MTIRNIPSTSNPKGIPLLGVPNHPNWLTFAKDPYLPNDSLRVISYINICFSSLWFSLQKDVINHRDILLAFFFNNNSIFWVMNIYSDLSHTALKYLKDTEVNISNLLIMTGDFNIRDSIWDSFFPHHSSFSDDLMIIVDSFNLELSFPTNCVPTRYSDSDTRSNSVIDCMFLWSGSTEINTHSIHPDLHLLSDYTSLSVTIAIEEENIDLFKSSIAKNSEEEKNFIKNISVAIKNINISNLSDHSKIEEVTNSLASRIEFAWKTNTKQVWIMKHSKSWWNNNCNCALNKYRTTRNLENWKAFKNTVKSTKHIFFDNKIQEIANKKCGPWELINWVNKCKLPTIESIKYNNHQYLEIDDLWNALHSTFNIALHCQVSVNILNEITDKPILSWHTFSKEEFRLALANCNNSFAPGPDKLLWSHLKTIFKDDDYLNVIISIANTCIEVGYWLLHFKRSTIVVIHKPNKKSYDSPKAFRPIVLLNTVSKLIEKVIGECLQFNMASNDFIHPSQLGGLKFKSIIDAGVALTHIIRTG